MDYVRFKYALLFVEIDPSQGSSQITKLFQTNVNKSKCIQINDHYQNKNDGDRN